MVLNIMYYKNQEGNKPYLILFKSSQSSGGRTEYIMKNTTKNISFIVVTIMLILISTFFISKTVQGRVDIAAAEKERYFRMLEQEYVEEIRAYLNEQGYTNSGVSITRVVDEEGGREYQVVLHHKYLEKLSAEEKDALFACIREMAFDEDGCNFQINLLV